MPPRMRPSCRASGLRSRHFRPCRLRGHQEYTTATAATSPASSHDQITRPSVSIQRHPSTQPPSYKPPEFRKSQLLRQYASLLRSTPLMLLFQHNNLKSNEWVGLRRELSRSLEKVDDARAALGNVPGISEGGVKIQIIQTGIFAAALRVVEFYSPEITPSFDLKDQTSSSRVWGEGALTHTLSKAAHDAVVDKRTSHALAPLLSGPLMLVTFPNVAPEYMKAALSVLSPSPPQFPAPTRKANPGWHDPMVQGGLQKLLLLGARIEGKVFDIEGAKWVGGIEGGLDGLRAQLVAILQSAGGGVASTLESAGKSLFLTMEGRRAMLEGEAENINKVEDKQA